MRVAIGADTNGVALIDVIRSTLARLGVDMFDLSGDVEHDDYPDIAWRVALAVANGDADRGILVCGTGVGMCIVANKVVGIRAAVGLDPFSVRRSVLSNNAQVLTFGAQVTGPQLVAELVELWMSLHWQGGPSTRKVDRIIELERSQQIHE